MKIVYNSFAGRYSDSPRAIYERLIDHPALDHVWLSHPLHAHGFPTSVQTVPIGGDQCRDVLESADVVVSNTHLEIDWDKSPDALYLQTWHGTPLKHIHYDSLWAPPGRVEYLTQDVRRWDVLLSPNRASTERLRRAFGFTGELIETGYPRNDILSAPDRHEVRDLVRAQLQIPDGATVALYTPTWRDNLVDEHGELIFDLQLDLDQFQSQLGDDHVLLIRTHNLVSRQMEPQDHPCVRDVSFYPDIRDLYLAADVMITDYSSTMFDFAITGKPMIFYTYDMEHYRDTLRGFYFDFHVHAPGPLLPTTSEVISAMQDLEQVRSAYVGAYERFQEQFCDLEDGRATERVVERLLAGRQPSVVSSASNGGSRS